MADIFSHFDNAGIMVDMEGSWPVLKVLEVLA